MSGKKEAVTVSVGSGIWVCEDCGWQWPLADVPWQDSECDACGGEMHPASQQVVVNLTTTLPPGAPAAASAAPAEGEVTVSGDDEPVNGDFAECSNPPEESCADAGCPVHGDEAITPEMEQQWWREITA